MRRSALRLAPFVLALTAVLGCPHAAHAAIADRNHDKIFDDLERHLSGERRLPILVSLKAPATRARLRSIEQEVGSLDRPGALHIVSGLWGSATPAQIRTLARRPDVANVEEDATVVPFGVSAQAAFGVTQARTQIPGLDGHGEVAAVIDSGIDPTMPDLAGKVIGWKDLTATPQDAPYDDLGHGSLVSDILAGSGASGPEGRGVAPGAELVGVKVIDEDAQSSLSLIAQGIQWSVDHRDDYGIDAINLSIGDPTGCGSGQDLASQAIDRAVAVGITVIAAAGNGGPASCTVKDPGAAESALTVGAMADTGVGGFSQAWFSSRGPTADGRIKPDISAPGVDVQIAQSGGGFTVGSGTSAATPFMTGTALLMLQANPGLTPAQLKDMVKRTAIDWGAPGQDNEYGAGRLDAYAALQAAGAALAIPPSEPAHLAWTGTLAQGETFQRDVDVAASGFPLAVTMTGPPIDAANFDLTLLDGDGNSVGTATAQPKASRQEDLSLRAPAPGRYTVLITATTGSGDFVADVSGALKPTDTVPPRLTLDDPPPVTRDATPSLSGDAGAALGDFPAVVTIIRHNGDIVRRVGAPALLGRWSVEVAPPPPDGEYTVEAEQGDAAGNAAHTPAQAFAVDTVAASAPVVTSPQDGSVQRETTVSFAGTAEPAASVEVREAGNPGGGATADAQGRWAIKLDGAAEGTHVYDIDARDAAGNVSIAVRRTVTVDTVPPAVSVTSGPATTTENRAATFAVRTPDPSAAVECRLDGGAWQPCGASASYSALGLGQHAFEARATDTAGNTGPIARWTWTVQAPATPTLQSTVAPQPCVLTLAVPAQRLSIARRSGLIVTLRASAPCRVRLTIKLGRVMLAARTVGAAIPSRRLRVVFGRGAQHWLIHRERATLTIKATSDGARTVNRRVTLRR